MARKKKRQHGSGEVVKKSTGLAIRWREPVLMPDGRIKQVRRYSMLGPVSQRDAARRLAEKLVESGSIKEAIPTVTFREHATRWMRDILPMYKFSVRLNYRTTLEKHLKPRFGDMLVSAGTKQASRFLINMQSVQAFITEMKERDYSAYSIHHYHEVLRVILKYAKKWYRSSEPNPAEGITLPKLRPKTKPWALSVNQAAQLLDRLSDYPKTRAAVWLLLVNGFRRGELLALRWKSIDEEKREMAITEAYYRGHLDTPKTEASVRRVPLDAFATALLQRWKQRSKRTAPSDLIFGTRSGKPENPNNLLRRHIFPACDALGISRATYLTFRRTFSTWSNYNGVTAKDLAELMGHSEVNMQLTYIQTLDGAKRAVVDRIAAQLATNGHFSDLNEGRVLVN